MNNVKRQDHRMSIVPLLSGDEVQPTRFAIEVGLSEVAAAAQTKVMRITIWNDLRQNIRWTDVNMLGSRWRVSAYK